MSVFNPAEDIGKSLSAAGQSLEDHAVDQIKTQVLPALQALGDHYLKIIAGYRLVIKLEKIEDADKTTTA